MHFLSATQKNLSTDATHALCTCRLSYKYEQYTFLIAVCP